MSSQQTSMWQGAAGHTWVATQNLLDRMYQPIEDLLMQSLPANARSLLDVGCGTGATTLAAARQLGPNGHCTGVDISGPMLASARERAAHSRSSAVFIQDDAQRHAFKPASYDAIISRFGVMFFDDPVAAFRNLRLAARDGATLRMIAWRSPEENPFMTAAERSAASLLPQLPPRVPNEPGQFGFADRHHVQAILEQSGWSDIDIQPLDVACSFPEAELERYATQMGPVGRLLQTADDHTRRQVGTAARAGFAPYIDSGQVRYTAACWNIGARV
ncbi:class I SAM-dependent methyltransferase [Rugamonas aquatica]|uniref:Methyltransferase domain-containing protein n=1 Tax=Rugamonas aquatica TaxID=2743357 RepID=A0A6A7N1P8_9BURK|nr:class I SAM-dependent methyltransferase [Rugamonas aquatica]MQA38917.1 methyltransferase domain-containing protein [Rugamonas aquatica]